MVEHQIGVITHFTQFLHRSSPNNNTLAPIHDVFTSLIYFTVLKVIIIVSKVTHARYKFCLRERKPFVMRRFNDTDDERRKERKFMEEISLLHSIVNCNLQQSRYDYNDIKNLLLHKKTQYDEIFSLVQAAFIHPAKYINTVLSCLSEKLLVFIFNH